MGFGAGVPGHDLGVLGSPKRFWGSRSWFWSVEVLKVMPGVPVVIQGFLGSWVVLGVLVMVLELWGPQSGAGSPSGDSGVLGIPKMVLGVLSMVLGFWGPQRGAGGSGHVSAFWALQSDAAGVSHGAWVLGSPRGFWGSWFCVLGDPKVLLGVLVMVMGSPKRCWGFWSRLWVLGSPKRCCGHQS